MHRETRQLSMGQVADVPRALKTLHDGRSQTATDTSGQKSTETLGYVCSTDIHRLRCRMAH